MEVLLISGKSGHGKDTFADILKERLQILNKKVLIIHFADLVKVYAKMYYGWSGEKNIAGRSLLQYIGTDLMRTYDADYWARIVGEFLAAANKDFDIAIIPDNRFPNEIDVVQQYCPEAKTVHVQRWEKDGTPYINPAFTNAQLTHPSETSLDDYHFDFIINNYSDDMDCLLKAAGSLIENLTF